MRTSPVRLVTGALVCLALFTSAPSASAEEADGGFRLKTDLGIRGIPSGLNTVTDVGYRVPLFDSDNMLLRKTWLDAGATVALSPGYVWAGGYIEALPLQVLQLRFSVQYMNYFGVLGVLFEPAAPDFGWGVDEQLDARSDDTGVSATGLYYEARITPRIKLGNFVAFSDTRLIRIDMDVDGPLYVEPYYDMLLVPEDDMLIARPTAGYLVMAENPKETYLLLGARWERTITDETDITRDLFAAMAVWKIPARWWSTGAPRLAVLAGYMLEQENRDAQPYIGGQLTVEFGAL
jgi:hypothetical protein